MVQPERREVGELLGDERLADAPAVEVLDADLETRAGCARQQPGEQARSQVPQVQRTGRAGGEATVRPARGGAAKNEEIGHGARIRRYIARPMADSPAADATAPPAPCSPCRGTGKLISGSGGTPHEVPCPWCEGTGTQIPEHDAQAARRPADDGDGEKPMTVGVD